MARIVRVSHASLLIRRVIGKHRLIIVAILDPVNGARKIVVERCGDICVIVLGHGVSEYSVECIVTLGRLGAVGPIDLVDVTRRIVMPGGDALDTGAIGFRSGDFAVARIVRVARVVSARIGHPSQIPDIIVNE